MKRSQMFVAEAELGPPVIRWLRDNGGSCVAQEVAAGSGVADLVAGFGSAKDLRNRRRQAAALPDHVQLALIDFCQTSRTERELRAWAPHGYSGLRTRAIQPLLKQGLLAVTPSGIRSRRRPRDPFERVIAVELKLRGSERGLLQAFSYRVFADAAFLAIPAVRVTPKVMARARELGVGLLAVHDQHVDEVVEPERTSLATPGRRRLASEKVLHGATLTDRQAGAPAVSLSRQVS
jgi:hypothetical protein